MSFNCSVSIIISIENFFRRQSQKEYNVDIFSETDVLIGGIISNSYTQRYFWPSSIYNSDDLTWCVRRVKPLSLWLKMRYVATKATWIFCCSTVSIISIVILCLMTFKRDRFGYMNYEFIYSPQGIAYLVSTNRLITWQNRMPSSNNTIHKIPYGILLAVCILVTIAWNFFLIKTIASTIPDFQARTVNDIIERNFCLSGDTFSNVTVWKHSEVRMLIC